MGWFPADIAGLFREQVGRTPDRTALVDGDRAVTWAELAAMADRVTAALAASGVVPGDRVGLYLDRSIAYVASVLGVLQVGAAVLPLPVAYPAQRLREVGAFAGLRAAISADGRAPVDAP